MNKILKLKILHTNINIQYQILKLTSKMEINDIINYKNTLEKIRHTNIEVNMDIVWDICQQNKNRLTNFYGYWQISSSVASKDTIEFLEINIKSQNKEIVSYTIVSFLLCDEYKKNNLYKLLFANLYKIFPQTNFSYDITIE